MGRVATRLRNLRPALKFFVLGAVAFWVPQIVFHLWRRSADRFELEVINLVCPVCFLLTYAVVHWIREAPASAPSAAFYMLAGLWLLCPIFTSVDFSFFGGGFASGASLASTLFAVIYATLIPPMTLITAWWAGQIFGFPITTLIMLVLHRRLEPEHWCLPPAVQL